MNGIESNGHDYQCERCGSVLSLPAQTRETKTTCAHCGFEASLGSKADAIFELIAKTAQQRKKKRKTLPRSAGAPKVANSWIPSPPVRKRDPLDYFFVGIVSLIGLVLIMMAAMAVYHGEFNPLL